MARTTEIEILRQLERLRQVYWQAQALSEDGSRSLWERAEALTEARRIARLLHGGAAYQAMARDVAESLD